MAERILFPRARLVWCNFKVNKTESFYTLIAKSVSCLMGQEGYLVEFILRVKKLQKVLSVFKLTPAEMSITRGFLLLQDAKTYFYSEL